VAKEGVVGLAVLLALPLAIAAASARHGSLDRSFGSGGTVATKVGIDAAEFGALALQNDGKLAAAGGAPRNSEKAAPRTSWWSATCRTARSTEASDGAGSCGRLPAIPQSGTTRRDGLPRSSSSRTASSSREERRPPRHAEVRSSSATAPTVLWTPPSARTAGSTQNAVLGALALAPDGSLLVSRLGDGGCEISSPGIDRIVRLKRNGAVDRGFGNGGKAATPLGVSSLAVQPDGKVVGAGSLWVTEGGTHEVSALVRYTSGGSPDRTFGAHGRATTPIHVAALALQRDGKIVGAGSDGPYSRTKLALVRYGRDGVLDRSFGTGGIVKTSLGEDAAAAAVVVQRNGKIVVAGFRRELPFQAKGSRKVFVLVRYEPNGRLDAAFGRGGIVTTQIGAGDSDARSLAIRPDGKVVAGGEAREGDFTSGRFAVAQYQP
jgi:uncharacterized delta-60 repeat protein